MALKLSKKLRRILIIVFGSLAVLIIITLIFLSSITKYLIEKYSEEYTGRKITMANLHINVFDGVVRFDDLKIYEAKSNSVFVECHELYLDFSVYKLWASKYDITELKIDHPVVNIIQHGDHFNYDDIIKKFTEKKPQQKEKNNKPAQYWIRNFQIDSATVIYINRSPYNKVEIINWDTKIPLIAWNDPVYNIHTKLGLHSGGEFTADAMMNTNTFLYKLKIGLQQFNITLLYPYLHDYLKVKTLDGLISADMFFSGNMHAPQDVAASGIVKAEKFSIVDNIGEKLASTEKMEIKIDSINTKNNLYNFRSVILTQPYLKLSMYDDGYNFQRLMTSPASNAADTSKTAYANLFIMMADYVQSIVKNYVASNYNASQLKIEGGHFIFTDYTLQDKFQYDMDSLNMQSNKISSNNSLITIDMNSRLNRSGIMKGTMSVNPKNFQDMNITCLVTDMLVSDFNPYSKYYVATPFLNGVVSYNNTTTILKRKLTSKNTLTVIKIEAGKKVKNKTAMNLPIRLAVALLKDVHGNINLDIPVTGSLDDPKFKWGKIVWQVVKNIIVKAATAPFKLFANIFGGKEDDYKQVNFDLLQDSVIQTQQKTLDNLANILTKKHDLKLQLILVDNLQDESEAYALTEIKKQYISTDSTKKQTNINDIDNKDSLFNKFVDSKLPSASFMSVQEKCLQIIGKEKAGIVINNIITKRNQSLINYFSQKQIQPARVLISSAKEENDVSRGQPPTYMINVAAQE
jgi:hypothetical protein